MKFKSKEDLINNEKEDEFFIDSGYNAGIHTAFQSFAERIEFYKQFDGVPTALQEFHPKTYKQFERWYKNTYQEGFLDDRNEFRMKFNDWLFDYCFGDVK